MVLSLDFSELASAFDGTEDETPDEDAALLGALPFRLDVTSTADDGDIAKIV